MKTLFRKYPDGEIVALFPDEPGTLDGSHAAAFGLGAGFFVCDPAKVIAATKPASAFEGKLLAKLLKDKHEIEPVEAKAHAPKADKEAREIKSLESAHRKFGHLKYQT